MAHQPSVSCPHCHRHVRVVGDTASPRLDGHTKRSGRRGGWCHKGSGLSVAAAEVAA